MWKCPQKYAGNEDADISAYIQHLYDTSSAFQNMKILLYKMSPKSGRNKDAGISAFFQIQDAEMCA